MKEEPPKLYLVRRNLEELLGPMNIDEFKSGLERMQFGSTDEISGNCKPFIVLENSFFLRKFYPEIHVLVHQDDDKSPLWGQGKDLNDIIAMKNPLWQKFKRPGFFFILLLMMGLLFWAQLSSKDPLRFIEVRNLYKQGKYEALEEAIESRLPALRERQTEGQIKAWLPYLRWYAYTRGKDLKGFAAQTLRGQSFFRQTPCQQKLFQKDIIDSIKDPSPFFQKLYTQKPWQQIFLWDPFWIKRRYEEGWLYPTNYLSACVLVLHGTWKNFMLTPFFSDLYKQNPGLMKYYVEEITARLEWLDYILNNGAKPQKLFRNLKKGEDSYSFLKVLTCMESVKKYRHLEACSRAFNYDREVSKLYMNSRYVLNQLRLAAERKVLREHEVHYFQKQIFNISIFDRYTGFDYRPEVQFIKALLKYKGDIGKAEQEIQRQFAWVRFSQGG